VTDTSSPHDESPLATFDMLAKELSLTQVSGRLTRIAGRVLEAEMPRATVGSLASISTTSGDPLLAEVIGFEGSKALLAPLGDTQRVAQRAKVMTEPTPLSVKVGPKLIGRVLDGLGNPIDGLGPIEAEQLYPVSNVPADPLHRQSIEEPITTGVRAIDGVLTCGLGQRIGLFAGSGVGKSTLMGMIVKRSNADVVVVGLIGERNREVRDFVLETLGTEGLKRSVVVAATSDQPAMVRVKGSFVATAIAEYFRDQGLNVILLIDSVTRLAMAQREIGLSAGEPPAQQGYTPSVFAIMPQLMERAGTGITGSITAFYTVLVTGDDMNEPIADAARGILDGHIVLNRKLAHQGHYPAIDVMQSVSRLRGDVASREHVDAAINLQKALSLYEEARDMIDIGAYQAGSNPEWDWARGLRPNINTFLQQRTEETSDFDQTVQSLMQVMGGQMPTPSAQTMPPPPPPPSGNLMPGFDGMDSTGGGDGGYLDSGGSSGGDSGGGWLISS
jgi:flagellum-specific ATP synthase